MLVACSITTWKQLLGCLAWNLYIYYIQIADSYLGFPLEIFSLNSWNSTQGLLISFHGFRSPYIFISDPKWYRGWKYTFCVMWTLVNFFCPCTTLRKCVLNFINVYINFINVYCIWGVKHTHLCFFSKSKFNIYEA